jgi:histidinol-phosphate phosphatase family protein
MRARPFVFVDRDGTLIRDPGYAHRPEEYVRLPGADEALRLLQEAGFGIAIVTNQSGIGRGYYTLDDYEKFQEHLVRDFASCGVRIEASYCCPHRPDEGCGCRKPETGLLERARRELGAALDESFVIGDKPADVELARRAGCGAVFVLTGQGERLRAEVPAGVAIVADVLAAARYILRERSPADASRG